MDNATNSWLVSCRQLFDSALPTGAYAHSQGLEGLVQAGEVSDEDSLNQFIHNEVRESLVQSDIPVFAEAYRCLREDRLQDIQQLDDLATALRQTAEIRRAGMQTGRQTWRLYGKLLADDPVKSRLFGRCGEFLTHHQSVVVCGLLSAILNIPLEAGAASYSQQVVGNFIQACIKLLGFGPSTVQKFIYDLGRDMDSWVALGLKGSIHDAGSSSPRWDIASSRHAYAGSRLYIS